MNEFPRKQLLIVGDRVLVEPEEGEDRTRVGLYLPATAVDAQPVQSGLVIAVGPGEPAPDLASTSLSGCATTSAVIRRARSTGRVFRSCSCRWSSNSRNRSTANCGWTGTNWRNLIWRPACHS